MASLIKARLLMMMSLLLLLSFMASSEARLADDLGAFPARINSPMMLRELGYDIALWEHEPRRQTAETERVSLSGPDPIHHN